eukprot:6312273-Prymnesium_polylepis.1
MSVFLMPATNCPTNGGMGVTFDKTVHCLAEWPHATFLRISVADEGCEVAYETAVLGRLRLWECDQHVVNCEAGARCTYRSGGVALRPPPHSPPCTVRLPALAVARCHPSRTSAAVAIEEAELQEPSWTRERLGLYTVYRESKSYTVAHLPLLEPDQHVKVKAHGANTECCDKNASIMPIRRLSSRYEDTWLRTCLARHAGEGT